MAVGISVLFSGRILMLQKCHFNCVLKCLARPPDQDFAGLINWNRGLAEFVSATFFDKCSVKRYPLWDQVIAWSSGSCRRMHIWRSTSQESVPRQIASWTQYPHGSSVQSQSFETSISSDDLPHSSDSWVSWVPYIPEVLKSSWQTASFRPGFIHLGPLGHGWQFLPRHGGDTAASSWDQQRRPRAGGAAGAV